MEIREYVSRDGKAIFTDWWRKLRDRQARDRIHSQIDRLRLGNAGDCKSVGNGIYELRIHYGPGYRIYFGQTGKQIILLLCGGNKASQQQDVKRAKHYWEDYRRR
jgi:putative addiction module killer protein